MGDFLVKVSGVDYKICPEMDGGAEIVGTTSFSERSDVILRKYLEVDGMRYVSEGIVTYGGNSPLFISIPNSVERIAGDFCLKNSLCEIIFESDSKLKQISDSAFRTSQIQLIRIPSNVESFGEFCFYECKSLYGVIFESDSKLKEFGVRAFSESGIKAIRIPSNVKKVGDYCFFRCRSLCEVTFESSPSIGNEAFDEYPSLKCVNLAKDIVLEYSFPEDCTINEKDSSDTSRESENIFD
jgi:hypothetical protein